MLLRGISFDMIIYTLTEIQIVRHVFHAVSFRRVSQLPVPVPELGISNSKPCSIFETPLVFLMTVTI